MGDSSISSGSNPVDGVARDQNRQIEDLRTQHERKMALLRAQQAKEEAELRTSGDAAVNHIRQSAEYKIEGAKEEADSKIQREDDAIAKNYNSLKRRATQVNTSVEKEIAASRERADRSIDENHHREDQAFEQSQAKLKDFVARQQDLRQQTEKSAADQLREAEYRQNQTIRKVNDEENRELRKLQSDHAVRVKELSDEHKVAYSGEKETAQARLAELRRADEAKIKHEREEGNADFVTVHEKSRDAIVTEQKKSQSELASVVKDDHKRLEDVRRHEIAMNEKTQADYSREAKRIETEGHHDIDDRNMKFARLKLEQKQEQKKELNDLRSEEFAEEQRSRAEHQDHLNFTVSTLDKNLNRQTEEYKKKYDAEGKVNRETLHNQKELFLREQYKLLAAENKVGGAGHSRSNDPFYKPNTFDANLVENEDHYVLTAKVPAHEKENVDVRVKDGSVILSGARSFKEEFKDKTANMKTETSSHQSYRQEFALPKPADTKRVVTSIRDDGTITAFIPKKGFA